MQFKDEVKDTPFDRHAQRLRELDFLDSSSDPLAKAKEVKPKKKLVGKGVFFLCEILRKRRWATW
jgi:hypothetical protein